MRVEKSLIRIKKYPNLEKSIIVRLNKKKQLIYEPHESNHFDFRDDILYVEFRKFFNDDILMEEPNHMSACYNYLDLSKLATTNDNTTTFIIDEPNKIDVISKIGELESKSIFEKAISSRNSKLDSELDSKSDSKSDCESDYESDCELDSKLDKKSNSELDSKYFDDIKEIINRPLEHIVGSSAAASMLD